MACSGWQTRDSVDDLQQAREILDKAQHALLDINNQCQNIKELLDSEATDIIRRISAACKFGWFEGKASCRQLVADLLGIRTGQLLRAVGGILRQLSSAMKDPRLCDSQCCQCTHFVCNALMLISMVFLRSDPSISVKLSLAKQLQQAVLLEYLSTAMEHIAAGIVLTAQASKADTCSTNDGGQSRSSASGRDGCVSEANDHSSVWYFATHLLDTTVYISWLWPGGFHKSITARQLAPAAAKLAAALAQLSGQLCRENPSNVMWMVMMPPAVRAAHMLVDLKATVMQNPPGAQGVYESSVISKMPEFRQLLMLVLTAQAHLWLDRSGNSHMQQQQQPDAVQQLWVALGYMPQQLLTAADCLEGSMQQADELMGQKALRSMYKISGLIRVLGQCWDEPANNDSQLYAAADCIPCQQLRQDAQLVLLVMRMAKYMFLHGPSEIRGDINMLVAAVHCFQSYFISATAVFNSRRKHNEKPSAVFPVSQIVRLLLQFLQYSKDSLQKQQQHRETTVNNGSSSDDTIDTVKLHQHLQKVVLSVIQNFTCLRANHIADVSLRENWLVWGQYIAQLKDRMLRNAVGAAGDNVDVLGSLHEVIGPCVDTWLRMMIALNTAAREQGPHSRCSNQIGSKRPQLRSSGSGTAAAVTDSSCQAGSVVPNQAGPDQPGCSPPSQAETIRCEQAQPSPLDLQLLSLMTSFCKSLMQTVSLGHGLSALLISTQPYADCLTSSAAQALHHRAQLLQQPISRPAVRPWLSLLGKCLVMMGQRLEHLEKQSEKRHDYITAQDMLQDRLQFELLAGMRIQDEEVAQQQVVQLLQEAVEECSGHVESICSQLTAAKAQKAKKQLCRTLQLKLNEHIGKLRDVEKASEAAVEKLSSIRNEQQQLHQLAQKLKAQIQLCVSVNCMRYEQIVVVKYSVASLLCVAKILSDCLLKEPQQQQQATAASSRTAAITGTAALAAVKQQLRDDLLPTLVVLGGLCDLAVNATSSTGGTHVSEDTWAQQYDRVQEEESLQYLHDLGIEQQVRSAIQAAAPAAARLVRKEGSVADQQVNIQCPAATLSTLLSFEPYQQLLRQLVATGSELITALPHCWCCNNPGCDNLSADSELQLISGKQRICAGCTGGSTDKDINSTAARYCSVECQKQHWKQHKKVCRKLHRQCKQR